jgi:hypothetical protein
MDIIRREVEALSPDTLVEVGPGMGGAGWYLAHMVDTYVGYEPDAAAFEVAMKRLDGLPAVRIVNDYLPSRPDQLYDGLVAFEVLEHIGDDLSSLSSWTNWVTPGGFVMLSVPAKQRRFGAWDSAVGHFRRYDREVLAEVMSDAGLIDIHIKSYGMPIGYLLEGIRDAFLAGRLTEEGDHSARTQRSGRSFQPTSHPRFIATVMFPFVLMQRLFETSDWGIGWVAIGRRPRQ